MFGKTEFSKTARTFAHKIVLCFFFWALLFCFVFVCLFCLFFNRPISVFHLTTCHPGQPSQYVPFFFFLDIPLFLLVCSFGVFSLSFLFKFQQTDTSKATTRKPVEVITDFCVLPPPKLNSEIVLLIALNRDTTFSNKADNWIFLLAFKLWAVSVSEKQGLSEYFSFLKVFVLMKLEG